MYLPVAGAVGVVACSSAPTSGPGTVEAVGTIAQAASGSPEFYTPGPSDGAQQQISSLTSSGQKSNAALIEAMIDTPQAVWFTGGTPKDVQDGVHKVVERATNQGTPVLVAYNIPFRDCSQYSAGGAADTASYEAWIDAFASGIGQGTAVVVLEPDSLGIIPYNTTIYGAAEWCQPDLTGTGLTPPQANGARYVQINYAVDSLKAHAPNAQVYLDATHSSWLGVSEAAYRLVQAGVARTQGFFQNVSNYNTTHDSVIFGNWVSQTIAGATNPNHQGWAWQPAGPGGSYVFEYTWFPSQYDPATNYTKVNYSDGFVAGVTGTINSATGNVAATAHFVIDTSRNGQGPLDATKYGLAPYNQSSSVVAGLTSGQWCNPPGAGVGLRPTSNTGVALLDAYLWVKTPGQSDGSCDIAGGARAWDYSAYNPWGVTGAAENTFDPLWGGVDPAAGVWFPAQALQLAQNASPPLF
jgi:endoglucanase